MFSFFLFFSHFGFLTFSLFFRRFSFFACFLFHLSCLFFFQSLFKLLFCLFRSLHCFVFIFFQFSPFFSFPIYLCLTLSVLFYLFLSTFNFCVLSQLSFIVTHTKLVSVCVCVFVCLLFFVVPLG